MYGLRHRNELPPAVAQELDGLLGAVRSFTGVAHDDDGVLLFPGVRQVLSAQVSADVTTTSSDWQDVTGASVTMTTTAGSVVALWWSGPSRMSSGGTAQLTFSIDGRDENVRGLMSGSSYQMVAMGFLTAAMPASSHTFKVRFKSSGGATHTVGGSQAYGVLLAIEIKVGA